MKIRILALCLFVFSFLNVSNAQEADTTARPKIGLVLSGGAAKGLSHIGVLKVLEKIGISPDYITGTSMGAVVGGLYAAGYTAEEISEMNTNADWENLLSDHIPLNEVVFEEKYEYRRYPIGFPIRNYEFKLPSGLVEGQQLDKFLSEQLWALPKQESFDSLPIPFRCIGVDLLSGKTIVFDSGNLHESIRASMAIPSIFTPQDIDTMLLVDGGVFRNFPVPEVIDMGADIVIGVYVGFDEEVTKEDLFSMSDVISRATVFYGIYDSKAQMKYTDILFQPDLHGLGASDFNKAKQIELYGEIAALEIQEQLFQLADSLGLEYRPVKKIRQPEKIFIKEIKVINDRPFVADRFIISRSKIKEETFVSKEDIAKAVDRIFGTQYFKKVSYNLEKLDHEVYRLNFKVKESTRAFLNFGVHYDNQFGPGIITNLTLRNYLMPESRATVSLNIAENPSARIDINKYFGKNQRIMGNTFFNWNRNENKFFDSGIDIGSYKINYLDWGVGAKYSFTINQQIGALGFYEYNQMSPNDNVRQYFNVSTFDSYSYQGFAYKLYYNVNTTDDNFFPKRGFKLDVCYKYNFKPNIKYDINVTDKEILDLNGFISTAQDDYYSVFFNLDNYYSLFNMITFDFGASAGIASNESLIMSNYILGGYHWDRRSNYVPFAGANFAEYLVANYGLLKTGMDIEFLPNIYFTLRANIGFYTNSKDDFVDFIKTSPLRSYMKGYCAGLRANTILGPVNIMYGDNDYDSDIRWYISIGFPF